MESLRTDSMFGEFPHGRAGDSPEPWSVAAPGDRTNPGEDCICYDADCCVIIFEVDSFPLLAAAI
jgi:hypothetical protein